MIRVAAITACVLLTSCSAEKVEPSDNAAETSPPNISSAPEPSAGNAVASAEPAKVHWLVGHWLGVEGNDRDLTGCEGDVAISYRGDGTWSYMGDAGTWSLDGEKITQTTTHITPEMSDTDPSDLNKPYVSRLVRVGPDEMKLTYEDGSDLTLLRCPPVPDA